MCVPTLRGKTLQNCDIPTRNLKSMLPRHKIPCYSNSAAWRAPRKLSRAVHSRDETRKVELVSFPCLFPREGLPSPPQGPHRRSRENRKIREASCCKMLLFFHVSARPRLPHSYDEPLVVSVPSTALRYLYIDGEKLRASAAPIDSAHALQQNDPSAIGPHRRSLEELTSGRPPCTSLHGRRIPKFYLRFS